MEIVTWANHLGGEPVEIEWDAVVKAEQPCSELREILALLKGLRGVFMVLRIAFAVSWLCLIRSA